jgi:AcrR family transcriptional regulator
MCFNELPNPRGEDFNRPMNTHDERRQEVSLATARLMARRGVEGVSFRRICSELGYSTHVISHYFDNKKELILFTAQQCAERQVGRLRAAIEAGADILGCLKSLLPLDEERLIDSKVWIVFWAETYDPEIAAVQLQFGRHWRELLLNTMEIRGHLPRGMPRAEREFIAERLQIAVAGISTHGALGVWSPARQMEHAAVEVRAILEYITRNKISLANKGRSKSRSKPLSTAAPLGLQEENARLRRLLVDALLKSEVGPG